MDQREKLLPAKKVRERYGVSDQSIWRWLHSEKLGFPKPIRIQGRRYWRLSQLSQWEAAPARGDPMRYCMGEGDIAEEWAERIVKFSRAARDCGEEA